MSHAIEAFMRWWNGLAAETGKLKFKNQREAAEFVRRIHNQSNGPNAKIVAMRRRYDEVNRERSQNVATRFGEGDHQAVF